MLPLSLFPIDNVMVAYPAGVYHVDGRGRRVSLHADRDARDPLAGRHAAQCLKTSIILILIFCFFLSPIPVFLVV